jgi:hypothetical protein
MKIESRKDSLSHTPRECAFCSATANLTGEHIWSDWMNALFPGEKAFHSINERMEVTKSWSSGQLDWKAKVVCERCNNTWMSKIESDHAKPALTDLITGKTDIPILQSRANSIALFAFKTAVIVEHLNRSRIVRIFPRQVRHRFREALEIPHNAKMWMAGFLPRGKGRVVTLYHDLPPTPSFELYVCTYGVGRFVFQVVVEKAPSHLTLLPIPGYERSAIPFWPSVPKGFVWPPETVLETVRDFESFAARWRRLTIVNITQSR